MTESTPAAFAVQPVPDQSAEPAPLHAVEYWGVRVFGAAVIAAFLIQFAFNLPGLLDALASMFTQGESHSTEPAYYISSVAATLIAVFAGYRLLIVPRNDHIPAIRASAWMLIAYYAFRVVANPLRAGSVLVPELQPWLIVGHVFPWQLYALNGVFAFIAMVIAIQFLRFLREGLIWLTIVVGIHVTLWGAVIGVSTFEEDIGAAALGELDIRSVIFLVYVASLMFGSHLIPLWLGLRYRELYR